MVRLSDVLADGKALFLGEGIMRARYRDPQQNGAFNPGKLSKIEPDKVYPYTIELATKPEDKALGTDEQWDSAVKMLADALEAVGIERGDYVIRVNNRKVLNGVLEEMRLGDDQQLRDAVMRTIDKFDKVGIDGIVECASHSCNNCWCLNVVDCCSQNSSIIHS